MLTLFCPPTGSPQPAGRLWHSASQVVVQGQERLIVVGGAVPLSPTRTCFVDCGALGDVWLLAITAQNTAQWVSLDPLPTPRYWHVAFTYHNALWLFGGRNELLFGSESYAPVHPSFLKKKFRPTPQLICFSACQHKFAGGSALFFCRWCLEAGHECCFTGVEQ
jgi:hypothetical protein